jgi:Cu2+-exporting ATPase
MRCAGCISKLENGLPHMPGIIAARVNFTAKRVKIDHLPEMDLPALKAAIASFGFEAEPINATGAAKDGEESRTLLKYLAVAGFAAMNIMLLSVSVWSGADGAIRDLFHWLLCFGRICAQEPPHQHGCTDFDRRAPDHRDQPV